MTELCLRCCGVYFRLLPIIELRPGLPRPFHMDAVPCPIRSLVNNCSSEPEAPAPLTEPQFLQRGPEQSASLAQGRPMTSYNHHFSHGFPDVADVRFSFFSAASARVVVHPARLTCFPQRCAQVRWPLHLVLLFAFLRAEVDASNYLSARVDRAA